MSATLNIMQYNSGKANYGTTRPLLIEVVSPATHAMLVVQEPAFNKQTRTTYCPVGYSLAYGANPVTRVCFMLRQKKISNPFMAQHTKDSVPYP